MELSEATSYASSVCSRHLPVSGGYFTVRCPYTRVFSAAPMLWKKKAEIGREHSLTEEYYLDSAFLFIHRWKPAEPVYLALNVKLDGR